MIVCDKVSNDLKLPFEALIHQLDCSRVKSVLRIEDVKGRINIEMRSGLVSVEKIVKIDSENVNFQTNTAFDVLDSAEAYRFKISY